MPNFVTTAIARFCPDEDPRPSATPGIYVPPTYGAPDMGTTVDTTSPVSADKKKFIMEVVGVFLFYARMVDHSMLPAVTLILSASQLPPSKRSPPPTSCSAMHPPIELTRSASLPATWSSK